jgi:histidyl-tRNA synthetase
MTTTLPPLLADQLSHALQDQLATVQCLTAELDQSGYLPISTPLVEHAALFLIKAGDAAINRLVSFELAGQTLCLRPEFTAPAARAYIEHFQHQPGTIRLQFAGQILQYEDLKHGEITQQHAVGAELINEHSAAADAEVIALVARMLDRADVRGWRLTIGHSGLIDRFIDRYDLDRQMRRLVLASLPALRNGDAGFRQAEAALDAQEPPTASSEILEAVARSGDSELALQAFMRAMPQRGPSGGRTQEEIAHRLLEKQQRADQRARAHQALHDLMQFLTHVTNPSLMVEQLRGDALQPLADQIAETLALLAAYNIPEERITLDLSFTRNLDYYTGIVFEYRTHHNDLLGGGGRYDELIGLLGATHHVPAVGFMLYVENVLRNRSNRAEAGRVAHRPQLILRTSETCPPAEAIRYACDLRAAALTITTDFGGRSALPTGATHLLIMESSSQVRLIPTGAPAKAVTLPRSAIDQLISAVEMTL